MQKQNVYIGTIYVVKVSGVLAKVRLIREHPRGGWYGTNLATGREIRIRTAARLRCAAETRVALIFAERDSPADDSKREAMQDELLALEPPEAFDDPEYARRRIAEIRASGGAW